MKRILVAAGIIILALVGLSTPVSAHVAQLQFGTTSATLNIPTPSCRPDRAVTACTWMLVVDEGATRTGVTTGTAGTLTLPIPPYCGIVQVDVLVGPGHWRKEFGHRHTVSTCTPTPTPVTPGVTKSGTPGTTGTTPAAQLTALSHPSSAAAAQLPFTGADYRSIGSIGLATVGLGALLMYRRKPKIVPVRHTFWEIFDNLG